jgi:hypothetical protein
VAVPGRPAAPAARTAAVAAEAAAPTPPAARPVDTRLLPTEDELVQRVLAALQQQVDLVLEFRVRELMSPILARAADSVVREARTELARSLREVVSRAVAEELRRQREG